MNKIFWGLGLLLVGSYWLLSDRKSLNNLSPSEPTISRGDLPTKVKVSQKLDDNKNRLPQSQNLSPQEVQESYFERLQNLRSAWKEGMKKIERNLIENEFFKESLITLLLEEASKGTANPYNDLIPRKVREKVGKLHSEGRCFRSSSSISTQEQNLEVVASLYFDYYYAGVSETKVPIMSRRPTGATVKLKIGQINEQSQILDLRQSRYSGKQFLIFDLNKNPTPEARSISFLALELPQQASESTELWVAGPRSTKWTQLKSGPWVRNQSFFEVNPPHYEQTEGSDPCYEAPPEN